GGEERLLRLVESIDLRMGDAGEDREVAPEVLQDLEVRRQGVLLPRLLLKELLREDALVGLDRNHPARNLAPGRPGQALEPRKRERRPGAAQEGPTIHAVHHL